MAGGETVKDGERAALACMCSDRRAANDAHASLGSLRMTVVVHGAMAAKLIPPSLAQLAVIVPWATVAVRLLFLRYHPSIPFPPCPICFPCPLSLLPPLSLPVLSLLPPISSLFVISPLPALSPLPVLSPNILLPALSILPSLSPFKPPPFVISPHPSPLLYAFLSLTPLCHTPFSPSPLLYPFLSLTPFCYTPFSPLLPSAIPLSLPYSPWLYPFLSLTPLGYTPFSPVISSQTPLNPPCPLSPSHRLSPLVLPSPLPALSRHPPLSPPLCPVLSPLPSLSFLPSLPCPIPSSALSYPLTLACPIPSPLAIPGEHAKGPNELHGRTASLAPAFSMTNAQTSYIAYRDR
ncbi:unnamed protein product [Closterium sp. NIES-64]|nr:unnamed protein product [Closterium sp. NIES-64]